MKKQDSPLQEMLALARSARDHAYAPYSRFQVGAALLLGATGEIVTGCNVENASYGATVCAERTAILAAVARFGADFIRQNSTELLVVTGANPPAVPCALCLQVLQEFCAPSLKVHLADPDGVRRTLTLRDLLPHPFSTFA